ncbi:MAG TPA: hypothetical protein VMD75_18080 [Candidatus Binataceae bacterium]|nr:hypothetical protein [Candidatus Binataceae bacterium]
MLRINHERDATGQYKLKTALAAFALVIGLSAAAMAADSSQAVGVPAAGTPPGTSLYVQLLQKAQPDECFVGIGSPENLYPATMPCAQGIPKVNQGYIWGMTKAGQNLWYGTSANQLCTVIASIFVQAGVQPPPFESSNLVCEFSQSNYLVTHPTVPPALGDWRPPEILMMDRTTNAVSNVTPDDPLIQQTLGIRAAGASNDIVLLGGPVLAPFGMPAPGINLFAFRNSTGKYLGSITLGQYADIRIFIQYQGVLYVGVQNQDGSGSVLRWRGDGAHPFQFVEVGHVDNDAAYILVNRNRIFASTWGGMSSPSHQLSGLWVSPQIPVGGLTAPSASHWKEIWRVDDFEPDPVTAQTILGGALGSYNGFLYWGTMQVPMIGALANISAYPRIPTPADLIETVIGTVRPDTIFRCCSSSVSKPNIRLMYGDALLQVYNPMQGWQTEQNKMNAQALFGPAGFGNPFNVYTWSMATYDNQLFVGTFDWSYVSSDLLDALMSALGIFDPTQIATIQTLFGQYLAASGATFGADLWRFKNNQGAFAETQYGAGNYLNYGFRTMIADKRLFVGTANPMNLATNPVDAPLLGGFELLGMSP